jgi:hypothetical protein
MDREGDRRYNRRLMPPTVLEIKGIPATVASALEAAVVAGGWHATGPHEAWITALSSECIELYIRYDPRVLRLRVR